MGSPNDISSIVTPELLESILASKTHWPKEATLNFREVADVWSGRVGDQQVFYKLCVPALKALSKIGLSNMPNLLDLLPPPESKKFPEHALALQQLLDQAPRYLKGVDKRWCNSYFDMISLDLAHQFAALPVALQPQRKERWLNEVGASFDTWALVQIWFTAPWMHSEDIKDHEAGAIAIEEWRQEVEKHSGKIDPYRTEKEKNSKDTLAFSSLFMSGGVLSNPDIKMEDFMFWWMLIKDVHKPIIVEFGRYPYRNAVVGIVSTEKEKAWLEETGHFGEPDAETIRLIGADIKAGIWTPLNGVYEN
jgi:uncharacterized protein (DUF924 family)